MHSGIYVIQHLPTGRKYIGSSKDVRTRLYRHKWHLKKGTHVNKKLQNSWTKNDGHGFAFYQIIEASIETILDIEQRILDWLNPHYNLAHFAAGGFGARHTEETREKMRKIQKERYANGDTPWNKGKTDIYSQETIEKIRKAAKAQPRVKRGDFSEEHRRKLSNAKKGKPSWSKGKTFSEEHKQKLSNSKIGKKMPARTKQHSEKLAEAKRLWWAKKKQQTELSNAIH